MPAFLAEAAGALAAARASGAPGPSPRPRWARRWRCVAAYRAHPRARRRPRLRRRDAVVRAVRRFGRRGGRHVPPGAARARRWTCATSAAAALDDPGDVVDRGAAADLGPGQGGSVRARGAPRRRDGPRAPSRLRRPGGGGRAVRDASPAARTRAACAWIAWRWTAGRSWPPLRIVAAVVAAALLLGVAAGAAGAGAAVATWPRRSPCGPGGGAGGGADGAPSRSRTPSRRSAWPGRWWRRVFAAATRSNPRWTPPLPGRCGARGGDGVRGVAGVGGLPALPRRAFHLPFADRGGDPAGPLPALLPSFPREHPEPPGPVGQRDRAASLPVPHADGAAVRAAAALVPRDREGPAGARAGDAGAARGARWRSASRATARRRGPPPSSRRWRRRSRCSGSAT